MDPSQSSSKSSIAENLLRQPNKPILKRPSIGVINNNDLPSSINHEKHQHYDEENVKATYGPGLPNKDYGHQKIEEAKTPFHYEDGEEKAAPLNQSDLLAKINKIEEDPNHPSRSRDTKEFHLTNEASKSLGKYQVETNLPDGQSSSSNTTISKPCTYEVIEDNNFDKHDAERRLSVDEKKKKDKFDQARKKHYNMAEQMALARKLMEEEDDEDDE